MQAPKMADFPPHLFKYRSLRNDEEREWLRQTLQQHDFYWAAPSSFNDPFDCASIFKEPPKHLRKDVIRRVVQYEMPGANRAERRKRERELERVPEGELQANLDRMIPEVMEETAVYSVASCGDDVLMWSHYGASHTGVALRFRPRPLLRAFGVAFPIHYSAERPTVVVGADSKLEVLQKMLLTKADFWEYEREWRFIGWREGAGLRQFPPDALDGIILGAKVSEADAALVRGWISERDAGPIEVLRARLDPQLFRIDVGA